MTDGDRRAFRPGDRVRVLSGAFEGYEGVVVESPRDSDLIPIDISIHGRHATIELSSDVLRIARDS